MLNSIQQHLKTLFSSAAFKAWVAGLSTVIGAYLIPVISNWLNGLTADQLVAWFGSYGLTVGYGTAAVVVGLLGTVWTYFTKNKPEAEIQ